MANLGQLVPVSLQVLSTHDPEGVGGKEVAQTQRSERGVREEAGEKAGERWKV